MPRRILFASLGAPAWGDANATAYNLQERLQAGAFDPVLVYLLTDADTVFFRHVFGESFANPRHIRGVRSCRLDEPVLQLQGTFANLVDAVAPEVVVAWGIAATRVLRLAVPTLPLVLMVSHCDRLERLIASAAVRDFLQFRAAVARGVAYRVRPNDPELEALRACDLAVLPSELARVAFANLFPADVGKMYACPLPLADVWYQESQRFQELHRPFPDRDIDVLFVAPEWQLTARNVKLALRLCDRLPNRNIHLVGELEGAHGLQARTHGVLPRHELYSLLGRSKAAVFPGLAEAAPWGMFAASAMGCNVVASADCGFWELCHNDLCATQSAVAPFLGCIDRALSKPFPDQRDRFSIATPELIEALAGI